MLCGIICLCCAVLHLARMMYGIQIFEITRKVNK